MKAVRKRNIVLVVLAVIAAAVLFTTYGTVLPSAPFAKVQLNGPSLVDSNGKVTVVADGDSRRALILNGDNDLTGVIGCTTIDSPIDAITDVCVRNELVYVSGMRFVPDSDVIERERVVVYDKGGNYVETVYDKEGSGETRASIKSLNDSSDGIIVAYTGKSAEDAAQDASGGTANDKTGPDASSAGSSVSASSSASASGSANSGSASGSASSASAEGEAGTAGEAGTSSAAGEASASSSASASSTAGTRGSDGATGTKGSQGEEDAKAANLVFELIETGAKRAVDAGDIDVHDAAHSAGVDGHYAILSVRGVLDDDVLNHEKLQYAGHVFTAIDIDGGNLYACDDETGALCVISEDSDDARTLVEGDGYNDVHVNNGVISLCSRKADRVKLCDMSGAVISEFTEVRPSIGFSLRMLLVWASALYLIILALTFAIRKVMRQVKEGKTEGIGPMLLSVAVVSAIAVAVGSFSYSSYQKSLELRANEINMCADYLQTCVRDLSEPMEAAGNRDKLRGDEGDLGEAVMNLIQAATPPLELVDAANANNIGMYFTIYAKDERGVFYLYGSSSEYALGTSEGANGRSELQAAFEGDKTQSAGLLRGRTLRDSTQYRLVSIPTVDGQGVAGVIEIGSKFRSFEQSVAGDLSRRVLALLVMVLVVYLTYSEIRSCGRYLFMYRQRREESESEAVALLTRPFTFAITILTSIDSVMTVLIARSLLKSSGMGDSSLLLAIPAIMLGIGMVIGQGLYAFCGRRVGLRRLVSLGAFAMLLCACFTGVAVSTGVFWLYCVAKLVMAVPFGMLYALGYSLPRLAANEEVRAEAAGGVKRTDTSAAALGTVLGGYAAQTLGDVWVYALVAVACIPVIIMAFNLLPRKMAPLEKLAQPDSANGRIIDFVKTPVALSLALLVVLPATVAAGYASFLFPLFSSDLGLTKSDVNNIVVLGQLVVFICIGAIERAEGRFGRWQVSATAIMLLGMVFLLFSVNTTLLWSVAVIALVGVFCKMSDGWKAMWIAAAGEVDVPAGRAVSAMLATRSLALVVQPFILGALLFATDSVAVIVIGALCVICSVVFFLGTRRTSLAR